MHIAAPARNTWRPFSGARSRATCRSRCRLSMSWYMASAGTSTVSHIAGELFKMMAGVDMFHVPYHGGGPALPDLIAGQVQVIFATTISSIEYIRAGRLRALALTTATRSDELLPGISTVGEFLPGYEASVWYGIGAPRNTPVEVIDKLNKEI